MSNSHDVRRLSTSTVCLACGGDVGDGLRFGGSLRCADCRDANACLDAKLVLRWQKDGAPLEFHDRRAITVTAA